MLDFINGISIFCLIASIPFAIVSAFIWFEKSGTESTKKPKVFCLTCLIVFVVSIPVTIKTFDMVQDRQYNEFQVTNSDGDMSSYDADYGLSSNKKGKAEFNIKTYKNISLKLKENKYSSIKKVSDTNYKLSFDLSNLNKDHIIERIHVYRNGNKVQSPSFEVFNDTKQYDEKQAAEEKKEAKAKSEEKANKPKSASEIKKDNEKKNLAAYKQDLNTIPDKTKGIISKAYVDENGSEQTTVVLSDEALNVSNSELKNISHKIYNYMSNFISNYTPFPDDSLADSIRIIDSSGNLIAKTSWGDFKYVG